MQTIIKRYSANALNTYDFGLIKNSPALYSITGRRDKYLDRLKKTVPVIEICGKNKTAKVIRDEFAAFRKTKQPIFFTYPHNLRDTPYLLNEVQVRGSAIIVSRNN